MWLKTNIEIETNTKKNDFFLPAKLDMIMKIEFLVLQNSTSLCFHVFLGVCKRLWHSILPVSNISWYDAVTKQRKVLDPCNRIELCVRVSWWHQRLICIRYPWATANGRHDWTYKQTSDFGWTTVCVSFAFNTQTSGLIISQIRVKETRNPKPVCLKGNLYLDVEVVEVKIPIDYYIKFTD